MRGGWVGCMRFELSGELSGSPWAQVVERAFANTAAPPTCQLAATCCSALKGALGGGGPPA